ncbi:MAG: 1-deoxy-D-xylulose-5-phosphate reductoisomerase [Candidatus Eisenbacteria bacterium]|jgi:1-deoxy-D-xylulose-5-phosphate reductoisomerase|nr:1-deoxy-D-xylulose-5-phosphate reductoisomerase [Candidatus Eisenbacteria bacterium]
MTRSLAILGSTGSIGRSALDVVAHLAPRFRVTALAARTSGSVLAEQVRRFRPQIVAFGSEDPTVAQACAEVGAALIAGEEGIGAVAVHPDTDLMLNGLVGAVGLAPTLAALEAGKTVALANKESLVIGGHLVMAAAGGPDRLIPVDSEHASLHCVLRQREKRDIRGLWLTASGGALRDYRGDLARVTPEQALAHPTWAMGRKITVDSATMMNKGLEIIEAHFLFGLPIESIDVILHAQSMVHCLVELGDGSVVAHLAWPDMRGPIQYALTYPELCPTALPRLLPGGLDTLTFKPVSVERYPCLALARRAAATGGTALAVMNAANEIAVESFLAGALAFTGIPRVIDRVLTAHTAMPAPTLEAIVAADRWARREAAAAAETVTTGEDSEWKL